MVVKLKLEQEEGVTGELSALERQVVDVFVAHWIGSFQG